MATTTPVKKSVGKTTEGLSQQQLIARRFFGNPIAVVSLALLVLIFVFASSAIGIFGIPGWWQHDYIRQLPMSNGARPTLEVSLIPEWFFPEIFNSKGVYVILGDHPFGQSRTGVDYFAQTMRGIQNSYVVLIIISGVGTVLGTIVGAIAGYYRGWVDALLMRMTDVFIVLPSIVIGAVVGQMTGGLGVYLLALMLGLTVWMGIARLVRAEFLSLREREFVEAARVAGASDMRIIFKHILPNAVGVMIVSATLLAASAILLETGLSFLGYGIRAPESSLGLLVSSNQSAFATRPWLFWWPALFVVTPALLINFVGDGLRDAFDPRQKRFSRRRTKELPADDAS